MADTKISALTGATTPLAGTEVIPVVQSGETRKVSIANLTAGRAISATTITASTGDITSTAGNFVVGTSGKGIDFSATPGAGTSELLADYEEGDWTPVDSSGAGLTFTIAAARYTKIGRTVFIQAQITFPSTASVATVLIGGLPFTSSASSRTGLSLGYNTFVADYLPFISASSGLVELVTVASGGAQPTNVNLSTRQFAFGGFYTV
jgi:hypothetical protein